MSLKLIHAILDAKSQYQELCRELTAMSQRTTPAKVEEGEKKEEFDLTEFLRGVSQELDANGKKRKHLGVFWEGLHVEVSIHS
jgi:hypothetical protein